MVSDNLYFEVIQALLEDNREQAKLIGLSGLSSYQSYRSFIMLSEFIQSSEQPVTVIAEATKLLNAYDGKVNINTLTSVIVSSKNDFAIYTSAQLLEKIVKNSKANLKNEDVTAQNELTTLSDKDAATYNSVLLSIQSRIQFVNDLQIQNQLKTTIKVIEDLLGNKLVADLNPVDAEELEVF